MVSLFRQGMEDPEALELQYITAILHKSQDCDPDCRGMLGDNQNQDDNLSKITQKSLQNHKFLVV